MRANEQLRLVFMGTPRFAELVLDQLVNNDSLPCEVAAVYSQPDRRAGRGLRTLASPVKQLALEHAIPVLQPSTLRTPEAAEQLAAFRPDFLVVAAYGLILPQAILDVPRIAPINVHASLLPRYRGAAPIARAIMENWQQEAVTGVSIMRMTAGLDTGPVYTMASLPIGRQTAGELQDALALLGANLLIAALPGIVRGELKPAPQVEALATYAPKLQKADGLVDWRKPVLEVDAHVRGVTPWPGAQATFIFDDHPTPVPVTVLSGHPASAAPGIRPGALARTDDGLYVACLDEQWYAIERVVPQGKKPADGKSFANGYCRGKKGLCGHAQ